MGGFNFDHHHIIEDTFEIIKDTFEIISRFRSSYIPLINTVLTSTVRVEYTTLVEKWPDLTNLANLLNYNLI